MARSTNFLNFGLLVGLLACTNTTPPEIATASLAPSAEQETPTKEDPSAENWFTINLDGRLEVDFTAEDLWTDEAYLQRIHHDTVFLMLGIGDPISGHPFKIRPLDPSISDIQVFQRYQTSLTLMDEGPHVDLTDWIHYVSDWKALPLKQLSFNSATFERSDYQRFPPVSAKEIVEAVKARLNGDQRWIQLAAQCTGPLSYPCAVSINRYSLKFRWTESSEQQIEKVVVFEVPMGC